MQAFTFFTVCAIETVLTLADMPLIAVASIPTTARTLGFRGREDNKEMVRALHSPLLFHHFKGPTQATEFIYRHAFKRKQTSVLEKEE